MIKVKRFVFSVNRINNGKFTLATPLTNIAWVNVASVLFKHGVRKKNKKSKKKRRDDDSDDSDTPYEHGNPDLIDASYVSIKVNNFIRGLVYDEDGECSNPYTIRIFPDLDEIGENECSRGYTSVNQIYDWTADKGSITIEEINIETTTDSNPSPRQINYEIELEFGIAT